VNKLLRLLIIIGLAITGSAKALFRLDLNEVDPKPELQLQFPFNSKIDLVDQFHQQLISNIQNVKQALLNLPEDQIIREDTNLALIDKHLDLAIEQANKANADHRYEIINGVPHTGDPVDFEHARLMEELKKAEQHIHALGYVSMQQRSDITKILINAEEAAVAANKAHHEATARNNG